MEIIFEIIFGFVGEVLLAVIGESLVELGLDAITELPGGKWGKRIFYGFLYTVAGFALGALTLQFVPLITFGNRSIPILYFIFSPIVAGLALCFVSWVINRGIEDRPFFQGEKFANGAIFALAFTLTRSMFG